MACWTSEALEAKLCAERRRYSLTTRCWLRMRTYLEDLLVVV